MKLGLGNYYVLTSLFSNSNDWTTGLDYWTWMDSLKNVVNTFLRTDRTQGHLVKVISKVTLRAGIISHMVLAIARYFEC